MSKTKKVLEKVCAAIADKKGEDVLVLDVSKVSSFTDFFVICNGLNERQNQAICDAIAEKLKKETNLRPAHIEGYKQAQWILMDFLDFVVHIFSTQARGFYNVEKLWSDGTQVQLPARSA